MNYFIGVNGGATSTELVLADQLGRVIAKVQTGPLSLVAVSAQNAVKNLETGLKDLTQDLTDQDAILFAVLGVASVDTDEDEQAVAETFQPVLQQYNVEEFSVINDSIVALINGTDQDNGIILVAGTGSNCFGENERGQAVKAGGYDYLLADQGSGYDLGLKAMKAAVKSFDGRGPQTVLEQKVCAHFKVKDIPRLKSQVYRPDLTKSQIAQIALLVFEGLEERDEVCQTLIDQACQDLWLMVTAVAKRLNFAEQAFDLVLEGSIAQSAPMIRFLKSQLNQDYPQADLVLPHQSAAHGALDLALTAV